MTCDKCGQILEISQFPFCPHGQTTNLSVHPDDLIGGFTQTNFGDKEEVFYSKKAMLKRADDLGLRQVGDGDQKRNGWTVSAKTLRDAAELVKRGTMTTEDRVETLQVSVRDVG